MVRPDVKKWGQTPADLRRLSVAAEHPRRRERFLALYMIASQPISATRWAEEIGHTKETVLKWVHDYNESGPAGVNYRHTGGRPPFLAKRKSSSW